MEISEICTLIFAQQNVTIPNSCQNTLFQKMADKIIKGGLPQYSQDKLPKSGVLMNTDMAIINEGYEKIAELIKDTQFISIERAQAMLINSFLWVGNSHLITSETTQRLKVASQNEALRYYRSFFSKASVFVARMQQPKEDKIYTAELHSPPPTIPTPNPKRNNTSAGLRIIIQARNSNSINPKSLPNLMTKALIADGLMQKINGRPGWLFGTPKLYSPPEGSLSNTLVRYFEAAGLTTEQYPHIYIEQGFPVKLHYDSKRRQYVNDQGQRVLLSPTQGLALSAPRDSNMFISPVRNAQIKSGYSYNRTTQLNDTGYSLAPDAHRAVDYSSPVGTTIVASSQGIVAHSGQIPGIPALGNVVIIKHTTNGGNLYTLDGHMNSDGIMVAKGYDVRKGQPIGKIGMSGRTFGPHNHHEIFYKQGSQICYLNPEKFNPRSTEDIIKAKKNVHQRDCDIKPDIANLLI